MKLYTGKGDHGKTNLFGQVEVDKDALRVAAYGTVDELNAAVGFAAAACKHEDVAVMLSRLQGELFELGAVLCTPPDKPNDYIKPITEQHIERLEKEIDTMTEACGPLKTFILPGGSELAARLHLARCVSRRAERLVVTLAHKEKVESLVLIYMNRLSDHLFALARQANRLENVKDVPWHG